MSEPSYHEDLIRFSFDQQSLPEQEREVAQSIELNLGQMEICAADFSHSLQLFYFARNQIETGKSPVNSPMFSAWISAAVRNGAMMANSISILMEAINKTWPKAPTIWGKADKHEKDFATKLFAVEFPTIGSVRKHAAHPGEFTKSTDEIRRHQMPEVTLPGLEQAQDFKITFIHNHLSATEDGVVLSSTYLGKVVDYELSPAKLDALRRVCTHYKRTFFPLEPAEVRDMREKWAANGLPEGLSELIRKHPLFPG